MTRKAITTSHVSVTCDVCGRTLLRGEHADVFLHGGARRMVCDLCTARAANEGWIREGLDDAAVRRSGSGRPRSLLGRLRQRRAEAIDEDRADEGHYAPEPTVRRIDGDGEELLEEGALHAEPEAPPPPRESGRRADAAQRGFEPPREPRHVHAVPTNADLKMARALDVFNASEHPRTVAGVARSLGVPMVSVRPSLTEGSVVTIVVGWELSWYRYEVDLGDEAAGVRIAEQGAELTELDEADHVANAAADEFGTLHMATGDALA